MNPYRDYDNYLKEYPNEEGFFGKYGGSYLDDPELIRAFKEYAEGYNTIAQSAQFIAELRMIRKDFQGRPTPLYHCRKLSNMFGRTQIYLKREDLNHTGAHKLNHCMGEGLLAKYMGKKKLIAETGAGQHGVALATAAAYFGLECDIYMGEVDIKKQAPNVARMKLLGARVVPVSAGLKTLKEAVDAAFEAYAKEYKTAIYCIGTAAGPHPFPLMVRDFQQVVGDEARAQFIETTGHLPDKVVACVGGGSNSIGTFVPFLADPVELYGVEPLGRGPKLGDHAASLKYGSEGYINPENFTEKHKKDGTNIHTSIIDNFRNECIRQAKMPFVIHHNEQYGGHFPLWVAIELFSFGNLSSFYDIMKKEDKKVISGLYNTEPDYLKSWILALVEVRNICAHYSRLYNMPLKQAPFLYSEYKQYRNDKLNKIFPVVIVIKRMLQDNTGLWNSFYNGLYTLIESYSEEVNLSFIGFPDNWKDVLSK